MQTIDDAIALFNAATDAQSRGALAEAERDCTKSLEIFQKLDGENCPDAVNLLITLADIQAARGESGQADASVCKALTMLDALHESFTGEDAHTLRVQALGTRGNLQRHLAHYDEAEVTLKSALELAQNHFGSGDERTVSARNNLGMLYKYTAEFDKAEALYNAALEALGDKESSLAAALYHNLGGLNHARETFAQGEPFARKAWEINRKLLGDDHPTTLADACAYAGVLDGLERYDESEPIYRNALKKFGQLYGAEHYELAVNLNNLANVHFAKGDFGEAQSLMQQCLDMKESLLGTEHPDTALAANNLGVIVQAQGDFERARQHFERAWAIFQKTLGDSHPKTQMAHENLIACWEGTRS